MACFGDGHVALTDTPSVTASLAGALPALAGLSTIALTNSDFETSVTLNQAGYGLWDSGIGGNSIIPGWTGTGLSNGPNSLAVCLFGNSGFTGGSNAQSAGLYCVSAGTITLEQTVGETAIAGKTYTLSALIGALINRACPKVRDVASCADFWGRREAIFDCIERRHTKIATKPGAKRCCEEICRTLGQALNSPYLTPVWNMNLVIGGTPHGLATLPTFTSATLIQVTLTYTASGADAGQPITVQFTCAEGTGYAIFVCDKVQLTKM